MNIQAERDMSFGPGHRKRILIFRAWESPRNWELHLESYEPLLLSPAAPLWKHYHSPWNNPSGMKYKETGSGLG